MHLQHVVEGINRNDAAKSEHVTHGKREVWLVVVDILNLYCDIGCHRPHIVICGSSNAKVHTLQIQILVIQHFVYSKLTCKTLHNFINLILYTEIGKLLACLPCRYVKTKFLHDIILGQLPSSNSHETLFSQSFFSFN